MCVYVCIYLYIYIYMIQFDFGLARDDLVHAAAQRLAHLRICMQGLG